MWVYAVPDERAELSSRLLRKRVLPEAAVWVSEAMKAPPEWQALRQSRDWLLQAETVVVRDHTQSRRRLRGR